MLYLLQQPNALDDSRRERIVKKEATVMAHNLFGERFFSYRKPAWHGLGQVLDEQLSASQAFDLIGAYDVTTERLFTSTGLETDFNAIVRMPTADDNAKRVFGVVSTTYQLVSPRDVCGSWDAAISRNVETIGAIAGGATLFVTTKLPTLDVNGDEVDNYLLLVSPMSGNEALQVRVAPVRVVCQNTLIAAKAASTESYRIVHDENALQRTREWLAHVYDKAIENVDAINRSFRAMAETRVKSKDVDNILELTYTMPKLPRRDCPETVYAERMQNYENTAKRIAPRREAARELFEGKGVGSDSKAARGTVWGLYNAVAELENYGGKGSIASRAESLIDGQRGTVVERCYTVCDSWASKSANAKNN